MKLIETRDRLARIAWLAGFTQGRRGWVSRSAQWAGWLRPYYDNGFIAGEGLQT